jgi:hypothetical protein
MSNIDLDKGGRVPQNVLTYLGPSVGWKSTDSPVDIEWSVEGGGSLLPSGVKPPVLIPDWLIILGWSIFAKETGNIVFDLYKVSEQTYLAGTLPGPSNTICPVNKPSMTNAVAVTSSNLSGWNVMIDQNDVLVLDVTSVTVLTSVTFVLKCVRNIGPS